jgi:hypothetical protein
MAREMYYTPQRLETKNFLKTKTRISGLPMWLADIARDFDPSDKDFFFIKVKPALEKKLLGLTPQTSQTSGGLEGSPSIGKFKPQIEALKRFLMTNYPEIISDDVKKLIDTSNSQALTRTESTCLQKLKIRATNPKELLRFRKFIHRTVKRNETNRVADAFLSVPIFKESFTTIVSS